MKTFFQVVVWMLLALVGGAYGAEPVSELVGQWRGSLPIDSKSSLTIQFDIARRPDNGYMVILDSPDNGAIKNTPAAKVSYTDGRLSFEVPSLSGSYSGALKNGTLAGEWKQSTGTLPLNLTPYKPAQLGKAEIDRLKGSWVGSVQLPALKLAMVLTFRVDEKGALVGTLRSPDQGGGEGLLTSIELKDDRLTARVPVGAADINLQLTGDTFAGFLKQPGMQGDGAPLTLKRGEYVAPVFALGAGDAERAALTGKWSGQIPPPQGAPATASPRKVTLTFRTNEKKQFVGSLEFPDPPKQEFAVQDLLLNGTRLTLKAGPGGSLQYSAELTGKTLTGEWSAGPFKLPVVLTRN